MHPNVIASVTCLAFVKAVFLENLLWEKISEHIAGSL